MQGAIKFDSLSRNNEKPAHLQQVKTFYMSKFPVTQAEYMKGALRPFYILLCVPVVNKGATHKTSVPFLFSFTNLL